MLKISSPILALGFIICCCFEVRAGLLDAPAGTEGTASSEACTRAGEMSAHICKDKNFLPSKEECNQFGTLVERHCNGKEEGEGQNS